MKKLGVALAVGAALAVVWLLTPLRGYLDVARVVTAGQSLRASPWAPVVVLAVYLGGALVLFPLTPLLAATALIFAPATAFAYCLGGALAGAALGYGVGHALGQQRVGWMAGRRADRLRDFLTRRGAVAITVARLIPVGNFSIVNMLAGALGMPVGKFALGNVVGLLPGIIALTLLGDRLAALLRHRQARDLWLLVGALAVVLAVLMWLRRRAGNTEPRP